MTVFTTFHVPGVPQTAGSHRSFNHARTGKVVTVHDNPKTKAWMKTVAKAARAAWQGAPLSGALRLAAKFYLPRPKSHFGTGRNADKLKPSAPQFPIVSRDDTDKLHRAVQDACKGILYGDDGQVVDIHSRKRYGTPRAEITLEAVHDDEG